MGGRGFDGFLRVSPEGYPMLSCRACNAAPSSPSQEHSASQVSKVLELTLKIKPWHLSVQCKDLLVLFLKLEVSKKYHLCFLIFLPS